MNNHVYELPSGTYLVVDPCYALTDEIYDSLLESVDKKLVEIEGHKAVIYPTFCGDGEFKTFFNEHHHGVLKLDLINTHVDSGLVGIIPECIVSDLINDFDERVYNIIHFTQPFKTYYDDDTGTLVFGNIHVETGFTEQEPLKIDDPYELHRSKTLDDFFKF